MSSLKMIVLLASVVASLTACGPSALYNAAHRGNNQEVLSLLASGKDIDEKDRKNGWTPLMIAAAEGHTDTVKLLLEKGADV